MKQEPKIAVLIHLDEPTVAQLQELARRTDRSRPAVIRWLIHEAARELGVTTQTTPEGGLQ